MNWAHWGKCLAEEENAWWLEGGRIAKKKTIDTKWNWVPNMFPAIQTIQKLIWEKNDPQPDDPFSNDHDSDQGRSPPHTRNKQTSTGERPINHSSILYDSTPTNQDHLILHAVHPKPSSVRTSHREDTSQHRGDNTKTIRIHWQVQAITHEGTCRGIPDTVTLTNYPTSLSAFKQKVFAERGHQSQDFYIASHCQKQRDIDAGKPDVEVTLQCRGQGGARMTHDQKDLHQNGSPRHRRQQGQQGKACATESTHRPPTEGERAGAGVSSNARQCRNAGTANGCNPWGCAKMSTLNPRTLVTTEVTHNNTYTEITSGSNTLLIGSITNPDTLIKSFPPIPVYTDETLHAFGRGWPACSAEIKQHAYGLCIITMKDGPGWRATPICRMPQCIAQISQGQCPAGVGMAEVKRWKRLGAVYHSPTNISHGINLPVQEDSPGCRRCAARPAQYRWSLCYHEYEASGAVICISAKGTLEREHRRGEPPCLLCGRHSHLICAR